LLAYFKKSYITTFSFLLRNFSNFLLLYVFYNFADGNHLESISLAYFLSLCVILFSDFGLSNFYQSVFSKKRNLNLCNIERIINLKVFFFILSNVIFSFYFFYSNLSANEYFIISFITNSLFLSNLFETFFLDLRLSHIIKYEFLLSILLFITITPLFVLNSNSIYIYLFVSRLLIFFYLLNKWNLKIWKNLFSFKEKFTLLRKNQFFVYDNFFSLISINADQLLIFFFLGNYVYKDYLPYSRFLLIFISLIGLTFPILLKNNLQIKHKEKFLFLLNKYAFLNIVLLILPIFIFLKYLIPTLFNNIPEIDNNLIFLLILMILVRFFLGSYGFFMTINKNQINRFVSALISVISVFVILLLIQPTYLKECFLIYIVMCFIQLISFIIYTHKFINEKKI
jgi:hypothetical protein